MLIVLAWQMHTVVILSMHCTYLSPLLILDDRQLETKASCLFLMFWALCTVTGHGNSLAFCTICPMTQFSPALETAHAFLNLSRTMLSWWLYFKIPFLNLLLIALSLNSLQDSCGPFWGTYLLYFSQGQLTHPSLRK